MTTKWDDINEGNNVTRRINHAIIRLQYDDISRRVHPVTNDPAFPITNYRLIWSFHHDVTQVAKWNQVMNWRGYAKGGIRR